MIGLGSDKKRNDLDFIFAFAHGWIWCQFLRSPNQDCEQISLFAALLAVKVHLCFLQFSKHSKLLSFEIPLAIFRDVEFDKKEFSRRETWLKVTFLFIPWAIGTWRLSDDSCRRTFQKQNLCRRMIGNFNENIIEEYFGQFISNPARQKKTNSTWCCAGAERFSALFVALRVWAKVLFLIRLSGEHIIAIMNITPISNQWPCLNYQITTTTTTITNKWRTTTWSCSALIINSSRVCFGFLSELGEINIFKIFRLSSSW